MTITGRTMKENLAKAPEVSQGRDIVRADNPIKPTSHLVVFRGNLSGRRGWGRFPAGGLQFSGRAIVFEREEDASRESSERQG